MTVLLSQDPDLGGPGALLSDRFNIMENLIRKEIEHQAKKLLRRHRIDIWVRYKSRERYEKRSGNAPTKTTISPPHQWSLHPHFNPIYCMKHSRYLAKTIWGKLKESSYEPQPALMHEIPKPSGDKRTVMVFSVPDAAVAGLFHRRLTERNVNIFSPNNYSYRHDRNVFDAIINLRSALDGENTFVIQYDFKKYFDSISHDYIISLIDRPDLFLISKIERGLIKSFLTHKFAARPDFVAGQFQHRDVGVPQGSSISLFLSNIAGHELDKDLEKHDGQFVRFADDVVAITYTYEDALGVSEVFSRHCLRSGVEINRKKSPGIHLLSEVRKREIRTIPDFDYLGHKFRKNGLLLSDRSIKRIKIRISEFVYIHLIQTPRDRGSFNPNRIGPKFYDWDLVTCLNEVRRYVYGGLNHEQLRKFIEENIRLPQMRGLMSFYPLVTDCEQLKALDGWLVNILFRAQRERCRALTALGHTQRPLSKNEIIEGNWHVTPDPMIDNETSCPSFVYAWRAARKYFIRYGLKDIALPGYYSEEGNY